MTEVIKHLVMFLSIKVINFDEVIGKKTSKLLALEILCCYLDVQNVEEENDRGNVPVNQGNT